MSFDYVSAQVNKSSILQPLSFSRRDVSKTVASVAAYRSYEVVGNVDIFIRELWVNRDCNSENAQQARPVVCNHLHPVRLRE